MKNRTRDAAGDGKDDASVYSEYHPKSLPKPSNLDSISIAGDLDVSRGPTSSTPAANRVRGHDATL